VVFLIEKNWDSSCKTEKHVQHWNGAAFITCSTGIVAAIRTSSAGILQHWDFAALGFCSTDMVLPSVFAALG